MYAECNIVLANPSVCLSVSPLHSVIVSKRTHTYHQTLFTLGVA